MSDSDSDSEKEEKVEKVEQSSTGSSEDEEEIPEETAPELPPKEEEKASEDTLVSIQSPNTTTMGSVAKLQQEPPKPRRKRFIPKYEVEGVHRIILGEEAQLQVEIVVGSHVNAQFPWKLVEKSKLLEDIENREQQSEFYPLHEILAKYPEEEILMGYIPDESKDYDEFYVCTTKESKDHCKQQSDKFIRRQEKKLEKSLQRKPRPWTSLGSEFEIIQLIPVYRRPLIEVEFKVKFPTEYDPEVFVVRDTQAARDGFIELTPYRQKFINIYRRRIDTASQITVPTIDREQQTLLRYPENKWTQSIADQMGTFTDPFAGGDITKKDMKEFFDEDEESSSDGEDQQKEPVDEVGLATYIAAFKKLRRPSYQKRMGDFLTDKGTELNDIIELNEAMDIYCNDYPYLMAQKTVGIYDSMTFQEYVCFTDVRSKNKYISCATFHPMWAGIVAISYADGSPSVMKFVTTRPDPIQRAVYGLNPVLIWSHIDSLIPKLYLECTSEVKVLAFCPFDENLLVGGCLNGQIAIWDLNHKLEDVETCEVLSESREKYRIAMNSQMGWFKNIHDSSIVQPAAMSSLLTSHHGSVTAIQWCSPNFYISSTGKMLMTSEAIDEGMITADHSTIFFSGSTDGTILIWNLTLGRNTTAMEGTKVKKSRRVLKRPSGLTLNVSPYKVLDRNLMPCYKIILGVAGHPKLLPLQSMAMDRPVVKYVYTPKSNGTGRMYFKREIQHQAKEDMFSSIYCGSVLGEVRRIKWEGHMFNTGEVVNSEYGDIDFTCNIHDGIICSTQRNPFINSVNATVGGKVFAIWLDELVGRPLIWKKRPCHLTDIKWSFYKPSLFFISTSAGDIETWDLLLRTDQPITIQTVSGSMLTGVAVHTLPLKENIIGVCDDFGSFSMFINPPIFMLENATYKGRMEMMLERELTVKQSFMDWQSEWVKKNPNILLEQKRKEQALLLEKELEKNRKHEEEERKAEEEAEARRKAKMRVIGPEERWQKIIQKLIERTIAVKKLIDKEQLIEDERPLRELEAQRLEKEKRMLKIMKNQKAIFNDTVAILFPEAIKKPPKSKTRYLPEVKDKVKQEYLEDYHALKEQALNMVRTHPYIIDFSWESTLAEGKERRQALNAHEVYIKMHKKRLDEENNMEEVPSNNMKHVVEEVVEEEEEPEPE